MEKHWKIVKKLQKLVQCDQFVVTGSIALNLHGLTKEQPHDIDIILANPTKPTIQMLETLQKMNPIPKRNMSYMDEFLYSFMSEGIEVNIFCQGKEEGCLWYDYVQVSPIMKIIQAKKGYRRIKDFQQLNDIAKSIMI